MSSAYKGRTYSGDLALYNKIQQDKKRSETKFEEVECNKIYLSPGVYKIMETPRWARQSVISFK